MHAIRQLEKTARLLDPDAAQRERLLDQVIAYANDYLEEIANGPAHVTRADNGRAIYDSPITEEGIELREALALLQENVDTVGLDPTSGRFLGYIPGGGLFHAALGDYLAAITNRYAGVFFASPGAVPMENMLLRWMADMVGKVAVGYDSCRRLLRSEERCMPVTKGDIVFFVLWGLSLGVLWWLPARLHDRRFGKFLWDLVFRAHALVRRMWVFSAETVARQEAEFVNEHPLDFSALLPWLARALLSILYLLALWAWIAWRNTGVRTGH